MEDGKSGRPGHCDDLAGGAWAGLVAPGLRVPLGPGTCAPQCCTTDGAVVWTFLCARPQAFPVRWQAAVVETGGRKAARTRRRGRPRYAVTDVSFIHHHRKSNRAGWTKTVQPLSGDSSMNLRGQPSTTDIQRRNPKARRLNRETNEINEREFQPRMSKQDVTNFSSR